MDLVIYKEINQNVVEHGARFPATGVFQQLFFCLIFVHNNLTQGILRNAIFIEICVYISSIMGKIQQEHL